MKRLGTCLILWIVIFGLMLPTNVFAADKSMLDVATFTFSSKKLGVGETATLKVNIVAELTTLTYGQLVPKSSDESVLTVESDGYFNYVITGVKEGTADIIFSAPGWAEERYSITVKNPSQEEKDYLTYKDQMSALFEYDSIVHEAYNKNRMDISAASRKERFIVFNNVIVPTYTKLVIGAKKIKAPNAELQAAHNIFLKSVKLQLEAFMLMKQHLSRGTLTDAGFKVANKKMSEGVKYDTQFGEMLDLYKKKYEIED
ncbi:hypothetical protein PDUR_02175 [Paenibacillus durus]|uniref:Uncharacterized protein n=2 Tax=Paenibacillus durus TaxID=44251 RepID=A0A089HKQ9_PAEDU|nr:hypothetical protein PDUR_02175 [Paenibacillus durus]